MVRFQSFGNIRSLPQLDLRVEGKRYAGHIQIVKRHVLSVVAIVEWHVQDAMVEEKLPVQNVIQKLENAGMKVTVLF